MPTPESEMFKAAKPTVPPTFDGVDYDDNKALKAAQDSIIREQWVQSMMARLVREELGKCYYREGVNHLEKCGHLRGELIERLAISKHWMAEAVKVGLWETGLTFWAQTDISSSSSTPRSRVTCSSSRTTFLRSRRRGRCATTRTGGWTSSKSRIGMYSMQIGLHKEIVYERSRASERNTLLFAVTHNLPITGFQHVLAFFAQSESACF